MAAKYASGGNGHARARLYADAMLGQITTEDLAPRILAKRNLGAVGALGLIPVPSTQRDGEILARYQLLQTFLTASRKFGAERRANEAHAVEIAMENLSRTAGYQDPDRLRWAMELREIADLRDGPLLVEKDGVAVILRIDRLGVPQLEISRGNRMLKVIPTAVKRDPAVVALRERKGQLDQQLQRMRQTLEAAMCRGATFTAQELAALSEHPLLAPMLEQLVFVLGETLGYCQQGNQGLCDVAGTLRPIPPDAHLRLAHPTDLWQSGQWTQWQHWCVAEERLQPFKQIFRECYLVTAAESQDRKFSRRYGGHQVQPRQAMALLQQRGWLTPYEGEDARRIFHEQGLTAMLTYHRGMGFAAPNEALTIGHIFFTKVNQEHMPIPLNDVPAALFSEVMRDLDLVVSVAHAGGVDPESSASTVEQRAALLRETSALLRLEGIRLEQSHAFITGTLGNYALHLGSGVVHRLPGGAICIVPIHAQHRGRIFLPFADDDPKTAEIVAKAVLLARDNEIRDPLILEQLVARA